MIKRIRAAFAAFFVAGTIVAAAPASAVPAICVMPTSGTVSGLTLVQDINNCYGAALSLFAGGSAPGSPTSGMLWWNTSTGFVQQWDGAAWINLWFVDSTNHLLTPQVGGGAQINAASAATTDLCAAGNNAFVFLTGSATITSFGTSCPAGVWKRLFVNTGTGPSPILQYSGSTMVLPGGTNIATAPGDTFDAVYTTGGQWIVTNYMRATGAALSSVGLSVGASALAQSAQGYEVPLNLQLSAAVAGNNLTVTVLGVNGSNPSAANPVLVNFRSTTLNNGSNGIVYGQLKSALSMQVTSGNTMGCTTGIVCRLWVTLICQTESSGNCTSILLGVSNQSTTTQIFPLAEEVLQNTGSGGSGGPAAGTIQTSIGGLTGVAIRIAGYVEVTWHSGTGWDTTPSKVQVFGPGVHKPGEVVQIVFAQTGTNASAGSTFAASNVAVGITPTSGINIIEVSLSGNCNTGPGATMTMTVRRGTSTSVGQSEQVGISGSGSSSLAIDGAVAFDFLDVPPSAATYTIYFNSSTGTSVITGGHALAREIMGALEPANDAGAQAPNHKLAAREWVGGRHERAA
jgi:hypothetical protein